MKAEPGLPLLSKSVGQRLGGKRRRQLRRLRPLWSSPQQSNPLSPTRTKTPRLSTSGSFLFCGGLPVHLFGEERPAFAGLQEPKLTCTGADCSVLVVRESVLKMEIP